MYVSHKIRIYPNKTTIKLFDMYFGYNRYCYNRGLSLWQKEYKKGNKPNFYSIRNLCKSSNYKQEWEYEYSPSVLDSSLEDLNNAFKRFFNKTSKYPKYKSKHRANKTFRFCRKNDYAIRIKNNKLFLPKFPYGIKLSELPRFNGIIKQCTISQKANEYFASFTIQTNYNPYTRRKTNNNCGIDLGLKTLVTISNGKYFYEGYYPSKLKALYAKINKLQKKYSKKLDKSSNKAKVMKIKLQKAYLDMTNLKNDYLHKLTKYVIKRYDLICIETLNVSNMLKNKCLSSKIYQSLFYKIRQFLEYKSLLYDNILVKADVFFPSTQKCSNCGNIKKGKNKLSLSDRVYVCNKCNYEEDRDNNAAENLRLYGLSSI